MQLTRFGKLLSGNRLAVVIAAVMGLGWASGVRAQDWIETSSPKTNWQTVATSADGHLVVAACYGNGSGGGAPVFISTNYGSNWTQTTAPLSTWTSAAASADGTKLVVVAGFNTPGPIYTSSDSGLTWVSNTAPVANWSDVCSSADGTKLAATSVFGLIYYSTNSGATWLSASAPSAYWNCIASSADGRKLVAGQFGGPLYTSTNSGATWTSNNATTGRWYGLASSADGRKLAAAARRENSSFTPGPILTSTNGGATWETNALFGFWSAIVGSANGERLAVSVGQASTNASIFTSTNWGVTWVSNNAPLKGYSALASSADGGFLASVVQEGFVYTSRSTVAPQLTATASTGAVTLSWVVPSTNFTLQSKTDLTPTKWTSLSVSPVVNLSTLKNEVSLSTTNAQTFYRLTD